MNSLKVILMSTALILSAFAHASSPTEKKLTLKDFVSLNVEVPSEAELKGDSG